MTERIHANTAFLRTRARVPRCRSGGFLTDFSAIGIVYASPMDSEVTRQVLADDAPRSPERRDFFKQATAVLLSIGALAVPVGAGLAVLLDPLRRKSQARGFVRITSLEALPDDNLPHKFPVIASRRDAWNQFPASRIGAVYLRRQGKTIEALNVVCPHAGCFVNFLPESRSFLCPCHNSSFELNGHIKDPKSPSPRALDALQVEVRNDDEVWVRFQNFLAGEKEKIPLA